jgi:hypothetical protein
MSIKRPKSRERDFRRFSLSELQTLIRAKAAKQIFIDCEVYGDGYVIPKEWANILAARDGTIETLGATLTDSTSTTGANGDTMTIGTDTEGSVIEVLWLQATWLCDATVANRTCYIALPNYGTQGVAASSPASLLVMNALTLSAGEYGYSVLVPGGSGYNMNCDNGTTSNVTNRINAPLYLSTGGIIKALISANGQAGDKAGVDIIYRVLS